MNVRTQLIQFVVELLVPKWGGQNQRTGNPVRHNPDREFRGCNRRLEEDTDQYSTDEELRPFDKKAPTNLAGENQNCTEPSDLHIPQKSKVVQRLQNAFHRAVLHISYEFGASVYDNC